MCVFKFPGSFDEGKICFDDISSVVSSNFQKQFLFMVDTSSIGASAVLMQYDFKGIEHLICYFSHKFNQHQKNYCTIKKETLALVLALQHFDLYLNTTKYPTVVYTHHNTLVFIIKMRNHNPRLFRWKLLLQECDIDIHRIKGKEDVLADAMS